MRIYQVCLVLLLTLGLLVFPSCAKDNQEVEATSVSIQETTTITKVDEPAPQYNYSAEIAQRMGNYNSENSFRVSNEGIYHMQPYDGTDYLALSPLDYSDTSYITKVDGFSNISLTEDKLFFLMGDGDKLYLYQSDYYGERIKRLSDKPVSTYFINENKLYYTPVDPTKMSLGGGAVNLNLMTCDLNGQNQEVFLDKEVYYPYIINDKLFYQDDNDQETEHILDLNTKQDVRITTERTYCFVVYNNYGYYISADINREQFSGPIKRVDLNTGEIMTIGRNAYSIFLLISDDKIFYSDASDGGKIYSINLNGEEVKKISNENNCGEANIWNNRLYYYSHDKEGYVSKIVSSDLDGSNKHVFFNGA